MSKAEEVLQAVNPPETLNSFEEVEQMLRDENTLTLCLSDSFHFVSKAIDTLIAEEIPGDILLAGVWRGGLAAYLQALLLEKKQLHRRLFLADTFTGFLPVAETYPKDRKMLELFSTFTPSPISRKGVESVFIRFDLPLENVVFLEGDIAVTSKNAEYPLAMLLIDVDFYTPTYNSLENLYPNVQPGGFVYVDDYHAEVYECKEAVTEFRKLHHIHEEIQRISRYAVYWKKQV